MIPAKRFEALTFDCYGTLIDWESGILRALRSVLEPHGVAITDREILTIYAEAEPAIQTTAYRPYKAILRQVVVEFGRRLDFAPSLVEQSCLVASLPTWEPFPDTVAALQILHRHFRLGIISNIDDDLIAMTARRLETDFDWIITAEQVKSYKPSANNFEVALRRIGIPKSRILHVAQSLYHDVATANALGLQTVWVNRPSRLAGRGATPPASAKPTWEVPDLMTMVKHMELQ